MEEELKIEIQKYIKRSEDAKETVKIFINQGFYVKNKSSNYEESRMTTKLGWSH